MPVYRSRLFKTLAEPSDYLSDRDFDLWVFGGIFEISVAVNRAYRGADIHEAAAAHKPRKSEARRNGRDCEGRQIHAQSSKPTRQGAEGIAKGALAFA